MSQAWVTPAGQVPSGSAAAAAGRGDLCPQQRGQRPNRVQAHRQAACFAALQAMRLQPQGHEPRLAAAPTGGRARGGRRTCQGGRGTNCTQAFHIDRRYHLDNQWLRQQQQEDMLSKITPQTVLGSEIVPVQDGRHFEALLQAAGGSLVVLLFYSRVSLACELNQLGPGCSVLTTAWCPGCVLRGYCSECSLTGCAVQSCGLWKTVEADLQELLLESRRMRARLVSRCDVGVPFSVPWGTQILPFGRLGGLRVNS